ncbi:MAG: hypothetical protein AAGA56_24005, partial [Myxococcota bacterium]
MLTSSRVLRAVLLCFVWSCFVSAASSSLLGCGSSDSASSDDDDDGEKKRRKKKKKKKKRRSDDDDDDAESRREAKKRDDASDGKVIADSGFRPNQHGFLFPNGDRDARGRPLKYPTTGKGFLDTDGVRRMFGTANVCLGTDDNCVLTPGAR